jgi:hypothetical protein
MKSDSKLTPIVIKKQAKYATWRCSNTLIDPRTVKPTIAVARGIQLDATS